MDIFQPNLFSDRSITLEYILRKDNNWEQFKSLYGNKLRSVIIKEVEKMLNCCKPKSGFATFICLNCGKTKIVPFTCKSRICSRCGKKYADIWSNEINQKLLNVIHRHFVLTTPDLLWPYFENNYQLQKLLMDTAGKTIKRALCQQNKKKLKITPGLILVIHPFGDDLKLNFHVHILGTAGGLSNQNEWVNLEYIDYSVLRKIWQYDILTALRKTLPQDQKLNKLIDWYFTNYKNGFVIFAEREISGDKYSVIRYIARYMRHPAISNRRIVSYDGEYVYFIYEQYDKTFQKKLPKFEFIYSVVRHIPDKQFKTVRRQGLYARRSSSKYQIANELFSPAPKNTKFPEFNWRENILKFTGKDPVSCDKCGEEMELFKITYYDGTEYKTIGGWEWLEKRGVINHVQDIQIQKIKEQTKQFNTDYQWSQLYLR